MLNIQRYLPSLILLSFSFFVLNWFSFYFTSGIVPAVDLAGHVSQTERLVEALLSGSLFYFDERTFSGWPAFQFYGFLPHLLAALSYPLASIFAESSNLSVDHNTYRLAVHCWLLIGCATLNFSVYYFVSGMLEKDFLTLWSSVALASIVSALTFWFLNHDHQWYGIGAAAPLHIGLFSQVFGWHFFLLHLGALVRFLKNDSGRQFALTSVLFAALFISHTLTAVYSGFIVFMAFVWFREHRVAILQSHLVGVCLVAFWLLPFFKYSGTYTALDVYRPQGDFIELFFRYPLLALKDNLLNLFFSGQFKGMSPVEPFLLFSLFIAIWKREQIRSKFFYFFIFSFPVSITVFSSGFIASSIPLGIHYYRFNAYHFLLLMALLSWPVVVCISSGTASRGYALVLLVFSVFCTWVNVSLPHYERAKIKDLAQSRQFLKDEQLVVNALTSTHGMSGGRVYTEYFDDYKRYSFLSAHYIHTQLSSTREVLNGLFVQSALAYRMPVVSANLLGAKTYHTPLLFTDRSELSDATKVQQLKDFGVSDIVIGNRRFLEKLRPFLAEPEKKVGRYWIAKISDSAFNPITPVRKKVVGYLDLKGNLPFKFIQYFLYARDSFYSELELVALDGLSNVPEGMKAVIINGQLTGKFRSPRLELDYEEPVHFNHFNVRYQHNFELDSFNDVEAYLNSKRSQLSNLISGISAPKVSGKTPRRSSERRLNRMDFENLEPGQLYRVNYSYFPYWKAKGAKLFRGMGERIFLQASSETAQLKYSKWHDWTSWLGLFINFFAGAIAWVEFRTSEES